ncbi:MAG: hypothetical protein ACXAAM_04055 [Candidatus Heimdallarchaeaceae archaeon]
MKFELTILKITSNYVKYHGEEIRDMYISKTMLDQPYPEKITVILNTK